MNIEPTKAFSKFRKKNGVTLKSLAENAEIPLSSMQQCQRDIIAMTEHTRFNETNKKQRFALLSTYPVRQFIKGADLTHDEFIEFYKTISISDTVDWDNLVEDDRIAYDLAYLNLPVTAYKPLVKHGFETIKDILLIAPSALDRVPGVGQQNKQDITDALIIWCKDKCVEFKRYPFGANHVESEHINRTTMFLEQPIENVTMIQDQYLYVDDVLLNKLEGLSTIDKRILKQSGLRSTLDLLPFTESNLMKQTGINKEGILALRVILNNHFIRVDRAVIEDGEIVLNELLAKPKWLEHIIPNIMLKDIHDVFERDELILDQYKESHPEHADELPEPFAQFISTIADKQFSHLTVLVLLDNAIKEYVSWGDPLNPDQTDRNSARRQLRDLIVYFNQFTENMTRLEKMIVIDRLRVLDENALESSSRTKLDSKVNQSPSQVQLDHSVQNWNLTVRAKNALKLAEIETIRQLVNLTEDELINLRNLGLKTAEHILIQGQLWSKRNKLDLDDFPLYKEPETNAVETDEQLDLDIIS